MNSGKYYIGDLCYVLEDEWEEVCEIIFGGESPDGEFELKDGRKFVIYSTAYGDGVYKSNIGTEHAVDSGSIGCIAVEDIRELDEVYIDHLGAIVNFSEPFEHSCVNGRISFGRVTIDTEFE